MNQLLGFFDEEQARLLPSVPLLPEPVGIFDGVGDALIQGPKHAIDVAAVAAANTLSPMVEEWFGDDFSDWIAGQTEIARQSVKDTRVNPTKMGTAASVVHSLGSVITMGLMGAPGRIFGAAGSIGGLSGYDKYLETLDQTEGDVGTAAKVGGVTGTVMGFGALLPAFVGKSLSTQILSGIGMNVPLGMVERGASSAILRDAGYDKIAEHYRILDGEAMLIDGVLGAMFPIGARALGFTTRHVDATLVAEQGLNQNFRNPGLDTSLEQLDANTKALVEADIQILAEGRSFNDLDLPSMGDQVPNPSFDPMVRTMQDAIDQHLMQETGMSRQDWESFARGEMEAAQVPRVVPEVRDAETAARPEEVGADKTAARPETEVEVTPEQFARNEVSRMAEQAPEMQVVDSDGSVITAKEMVERLEDAEIRAREDAYLHRIAITCARVHGA